MPATAYKKTTPRVAPSPMTADPKLQIGVGEKGGISVYGLGRFPVTLYFEQWQRLLNADVITEIEMFGEEHKDVLGVKEEASAPAEDRTFTLGGAEIALLTQEEARLMAANAPMQEIVKIATIKQMGLNRLKVSFDQLAVVQQLKARK